MSWGMVAVAAGTVVSGALGANASKKAAASAADASAYAADVQRSMYDQTRADLAPYRDAGMPAIQRLMYLTGLDSGGDTGDGKFGSLMQDFSNEDFKKDPGYKFRLEEGEKGLNRAFAARGLGSSTPGLKSLMKFNQGFASNEYDKAYNRFEASKSGKFNLLSWLAGSGQNAAAMTGTAGTNTAAGIAQTTIAGANASAAGTLGSASSWNNAIQGGIGNYMYQQRFDQMMNRFPVFSGPTTTGGINWGNTGSFTTGATTG